MPGLGQGHQDTKDRHARYRSRSGEAGGYGFITLSEKEEDNVPFIKRALKK